VEATDDEIMLAFQQWAREEGVFAAPEGAASLVAYQTLRKSGFFKESDKVVLFNTGSGLKYIDVIAAWQEKNKAQQPKTRAMGGIIQPY